MNEAFHIITPEKIGNAIPLISRDWLLITAGDRERANAMTASWGSLGYLWNKPTLTCYIRPQRYTAGLVEEHERISFAVLDEKYRPALRLMGSKSGRDTDKFAAAGLTCDFDENGTPYVPQARLIFFCRKLYAARLEPDAFLDESLMINYPEHDFHRMYICEIEQIWQKTQD